MSLPLAAPCRDWKGLPNPPGFSDALSKHNFMGKKWFCVIIAAGIRFHQSASFCFLILYFCSSVFLPMTTGNKQWWLYIYLTQEGVYCFWHTFKAITKAEVVHKHKIVTKGSDRASKSVVLSIATMLHLWLHWSHDGTNSEKQHQLEVICCPEKWAWERESHAYDTNNCWLVHLVPKALSS